MIEYTPKSCEDYIDWRKEKTVTPFNMLAKDQAKANLTWLAFPQIDEEGFNCLPREYVDGLHELFDKETRRILGMLPLTFMAHWQRKNEGDCIMRLSTFLPEDSLTTMYAQARKAQTRLIEVKGNVAIVRFGKVA